MNVYEDVDTKILGTIIAPESPSSWNEKDASVWLAFTNINGLNLDGYGVVDGRGKAWWDQSCRYHPHLVPFYEYIHIYHYNFLTISSYDG